jgi:type 1 glutamine amidotransferase
MVGGEFDGHNAQQKSRLRAVGGFAPLNDVKDFEMKEEWYRFKNIAPDMHVILVQETATMEEQVYKDRKPYPATWARLQGKGRVFYTSMGHREDVWTSDTFQQVLLGGLSWALGNVQAEVKSNLREACPDVEKVRKD